jgi:hypothetical protein
MEQEFVVQAPRNQGTQDKHIRIVRNMYSHNHEKISIGPEVDKFTLEREFRLCEQISVELFTCVMEYLLKRLKWSSVHGLNTNSKKLTKLRYEAELDFLARCN